MQEPEPWFGVPYRPPQQLLSEVIEQRTPTQHDWKVVSGVLAAYCEERAECDPADTGRRFEAARALGRRMPEAGPDAWMSCHRVLLGALSGLSGRHASWVEGTEDVVFRANN